MSGPGSGAVFLGEVCEHFQRQEEEEAVTLMWRLTRDLNLVKVELPESKENMHLREKYMNISKLQLKLS